MIIEMQEQNYEEEKQVVEKGSKINQLLAFQPENLFNFYQSANQQRNATISDSENQIQDCSHISNMLKHSVPHQTSINTISKSNSQQINKSLHNHEYQISIQNIITGTQSILSSLNSSMSLSLLSELNFSNNSILEQSFTTQPQVQQQKNYDETKTQNTCFFQNNFITPKKQDKTDQIDQDLTVLKKSFDEEKYKSNKKISANKTISNTNFKASKQTTSDKLIDEDQIKMLSKMAISKKKQCLILFKEWDRNHIEKLDFHHSIIELFLNQIDRRVKSSLENLSIYQVFFRERVKQQQKYLVSNIFNIESMLRNNKFAQSIYKNISKVIEQINSKNSQKCDRIKDFIHLINQNILKDLISNHSTESQKQLLKVRQKISSVKTILKKYTEQAISIKETIHKFSTTNQQEKKDLYLILIKMMRRIIREAIVQKQFGQLVLEYYNLALKQNIRRSQIIRESLVTYSKGLKQTYCIDIDQQQIEQMSKGQQKKLLQELYSFQELFQDGYISMFKRVNKFQKDKVVEFLDFELYLKNFSIKKPDIKMSILKQYQTRLKQKDKGQCLCNLVITVDSFLHFFKQKLKGQEFADSQICIYISKKNLEVKVINSDTERKSSMISFFLDSKVVESYQIQFLKRDLKEEFLDTIKKLTCK